MAVPSVGCLQGPIRTFVLMAAVAGIGNSKLLCQEGVGNGETVIVPPVALHIDSLGHVAVHTFPSGFRESFRIVFGEISFEQFSAGIVAANFMMAVGNRVDDWSFWV